MAEKNPGNGRAKLALHWKILIGLVVGIAVGLAVNVLWTAATWSALGVRAPRAFLENRPNTLDTPAPEDYERGLGLLRGEEIAGDEETRARAIDAAAWTVSRELPRQLGDGAGEEMPEGVRAGLDAELRRLATLDNTAAAIASVGRMTKPPRVPEGPWRAAVEALAGPRVLEAARPNAGAGVLAEAARFARNATEFVGDLFMRGLRFIAVPIVLFSLIAGVASLNDLSKLGRVGGKTIGIYLVTTAVAITVGLLLANLVGPGRGFSEEIRDSLAAERAADATARIGAAENRPSAWDVALDVVPANPFNALAETEMLQVVFAALVVGLGLTALPREKAAPVVAFFDTMTEVIIKVVHGVLAIAPYAVFALIVIVIADLGFEVLVNLAKYSATVVVALAVMMFGVYPLILRAFTKVGIGRFYSAISPAQLLAFSSSSSGATLPVTMECCEERLGASEEITSFVVPIGATINMDGTALYQGVAALFIAQMYGIPAPLTDQITIVLTATLASIGTAAVPGVGIVMLVIVLQSLEWPLEGIAVILGVDRILDMCRTACNVTGDCMVCAVVASSEGELGEPAAGGAAGV